MSKLEKYLLLTFLFVLIIGMIVLPNIRENNFFRLSENTLSYLFSSLLQSNAAILSIVGVFVIYKIQSLQSSIDIIKTSRLTDIGRINWPSSIINFDNMTIVEKKEEINKNTSNVHLYAIFKEWLKKEEALSNFKDNIFLPTILIAIAFVVNLVCLMSTYNIFIGPFYLGVRIVFFNVILEIYAISAISYFIMKSLRS